MGKYMILLEGRGCILSVAHQVIIYTGFQRVHMFLFNAGVAQLVEQKPSKLQVEGSIPFARSFVRSNLKKRFLMRREKLDELVKSSR